MENTYMNYNNASRSNPSSTRSKRTLSKHMRIVGVILSLMYLSVLGAILFWFGATAISAINLWILGTGSIVTLASNLKTLVILFLIWITIYTFFKALLKADDK